MQNQTESRSASSIKILLFLLKQELEREIARCDAEMKRLSAAVEIVN